MECTGELQGISKDWNSGKWLVTFSINEESILNTIDKLKDSLLSIKVVKYRKKRSLDANAYCWVLMTKIAEVIDSSKEEVYEEMLQKYGYLDTDDDGYIVITMKSSVDISKLDGHWKRYKGNDKFTSYLKIKGSSEYDTSEMAHFIDQVVLEAKELDIETLTPDELTKMKDMWGIECGQ